jgi:hypothetical protein
MVDTYLFYLAERLIKALKITTECLMFSVFSRIFVKRSI